MSTLLDVDMGERVSLMWTHLDCGRGQKPDFRVDVING